MILVIFQAYVKQFHTTGLVWNKSGEDAMVVAKQTTSHGAAPPAPPSAGPPPPPPGPPAPPPPPPADTAKSSRAELLDSLNQAGILNT